MKGISDNERQSHTRREEFKVAGGHPDSLSMRPLSVTLLGANDDARRALAMALAGTQGRVVQSAPLPSREALPSLLDHDCDVLIVDLDHDGERALELVELACGLNNGVVIMVYSRDPDPDLLVRCMRAGTREFLSHPLTPDSVAEALVRASVRRDELRGQKRVKGKPLVFVGAKGGSGTTTVASNFAVALARESGQRVVLVDLNLQLGDAALTLGMKSPFSTLDALRNGGRLDSELVAKLLAEHSSGLKVLAAPDDLVEPSLFQLSMKLASAVHMVKAQDDPGEPGVFQPSASSVGKLIGILRDDFAWIVIDAGCYYGSYARYLFEWAERIYMVTQVSVTELRNCNRLIAAHFKGDRRLEVVFNRYGLHNGEISEQSIAAALMVPSIASNCKIPDDFQTVRDAQNTGVAVAMKDNAITRVLTQMARIACGKAGPEAKKKKFSVFSWQRGSDRGPERSGVPKRMGTRAAEASETQEG